jgi:hypothetical protein
MSNISSTHTVTAFDSAKSQAFVGQRLVKATYKSTKKDGKVIPAKFSNVCASIPVVTYAEIEPHLEALKTHIVELLQKSQDGVFKSIYEAKQGVMSEVQDADISVLACIGYLEAESSGGRLTKEFLESWFVTDVLETAYLVFADKLGYSGDLTPEQDGTILKHLNGYKDMISALSGGRTIYTPQQVKNLQKLLALIPESDTGLKLEKKLQAMIEVKPIAEMLEL